ncbi:hypothetical protein CUN67_11715 [Pantoea cypripedii]|uniref:Uncharacterized protein n=1 Tax=Pantoea cypripedii TaxID=55209 RepID=A0A6B9G3U2_PANCY|nr:hypothetical protein CUN67_11715 [Pantoea cypripedii]
MHILRVRGDEKPRRGSTTGVAGWTVWARSEQTARRASEASQSPSHRHNFEEESERMFRLFFACSPGTTQKNPA